MEREREETGKRAQDMLKSNKSLTQERLKVVNTAAPLPSRKKKITLTYNKAWTGNDEAIHRAKKLLQNNQTKMIS